MRQNVLIGPAGGKGCAIQELLETFEHRLAIERLPRSKEFGPGRRLHQPMQAIGADGPRVKGVGKDTGGPRDDKIHH